VIVANSNIAVTAVQRETATIPIVFFVGVDPIDSGFVSNLECWPIITSHGPIEPLPWGWTLVLHHPWGSSV